MCKKYRFKLILADETVNGKRNSAGKSLCKRETTT